ncbi:MarR family winged helix-turn-helix transcriptional regulator [Parageobacillus genomosp. 1]|uniref:MarR family winged helix-turn-helix transcriptional regulator n=1 Tax=Parageobacillus genomosp. 1 TaxID=1295642 RepID=UPI0005C75342|nr:MarR family winged helix-turn-helix transcriptional regulator [Parageobacillus genomosp. 1]
MVVNEYFCQCLYFTANRLARIMNKMAEEEFAPLGLSPTYAFLLMAVKDKPGITQKELSEILHIAPSTSTRFVEKLEMKGLVQRKNEGKLTLIYPTEKGLAIQGEIKKCWKNLYNRYSEVLGEERGVKLTSEIDLACNELEK